MPFSKLAITSCNIRRKIKLLREASKPLIARSRGRPALVRLYICLENMMSSSTAILFPAKTAFILSMAEAFGPRSISCLEDALAVRLLFLCTSRISIGVTRSPNNCDATSSAVPASIFPETSAPELSLPLYSKCAMLYFVSDLISQFDARIIAL